MKTKFIIILFGFLLLGSSCTEVFEADLSEEEVLIYTPADNAILTETRVEVRWEGIDNALDYEVQLARPDFASTSSYLFDSFAVSNQLIINNLTDGNYELRIRAHQNNTATGFSYRKFSINSLTSLQNLAPLILNPPINDTTNVPNYQFKWSPLLNSPEYEVQISTNNGTNLLALDTVGTSSFTFLLPVDGSYQFSVRALKGKVNSLRSERSILLDREAPTFSRISVPAAGDTIKGGTVTMQLSRDPLEISSIRDSLIIEMVPISGGVPKQDTLVTSARIINYSPNTSGSVRIIVKSTDKAGNSSPWSAAHSFIYEL